MLRSVVGAQSASSVQTWSVPRDRIELSTRGFSVPILRAERPEKPAIPDHLSGKATGRLPKRRIAPIPLVVPRKRTTPPEARKVIAGDDDVD